MHKTPTWAIQTQHGNEGRAKSIKRDAIAAMSVARVGVAEVDAWHLRLRRRGLGEGAVRNQHSFLRAVFQQAVRWEWITHNPVASATLRRQRVQPRDAMTPDEVNRVLAAAAEFDPAAALALRLAAVAGARRGELAALRWEKVRDDTVIVDQQVIVDRRNTPRYVVATTKTANRRVISLDDRTLQMIRELRLRRQALTPWMFGEDPGTPAPDRIGWWWRRARALAGIDPKWRLHDLRHFSATQAIAGGHDVRSVAARLGHADASMTMRVYAHAIHGRDQLIAATMAAVLDDPVEGPTRVNGERSL